MKFNSITFKLLWFIIGAFAVTTISVLFLVNIQLTDIIDESQETVYTERIDSILSILHHHNERLVKTGLVEAYAEDFRSSAINTLRKNYYKDPGASIYPFILDSYGRVVMHPTFSSGNLSLKLNGITEKMTPLDGGNFDYYYTGQKRWCMYRHFEEWGWTIAYTVPLDIKYSDARKFGNTLLSIMVGITILVFLVLSLIVTRFTKPIIRLTNISTEITGGNLDQQIDLGGKDEVGTLARAFARMRDAIKEQITELNNEISERKLAEKALQESESRLSEAQKMAGMGYWDWNVETGDVSWSEEVFRIFHTDPSKFTPQIDSIMKRSPWPEHRNRHEKLIEHSIKTKKKGKFDQKFLHPDNSIGYYHSTFQGKYDSDGNLASIGGTLYDITARKKQESELQHLRNYLTNIIDSMPSVLVGVDLDGNVTQWNKTAEETTGIPAAAALGKTLPDVFPRMVSEMEKITESIRTRETKQEQKRPRQSKNGICYEDVTVYPLIANGVQGAVIRVDDVTDKVHMEEMMVQSEKMLSVGGLAAGMAHEINNPLSGMMQTASVMSHRLNNMEMPANRRAADEIGIRGDDIKAFMEKRGILRMITIMTESGHRVAEIVENMLHFARKSDDRVSSHEIGKLLDKALELAATDYDLKNSYDFKRIEIIKEYATGLPLLPCEDAKIQQVLLNILGNGAHAMQGAEIEKPCFIVRTRQEAERNMICMEIEDNGPGMNEETRKRIFEPFFTTKPVGVGTGLGLSVSYFIITENHGGEMSVESAPNAGAKFIIRLPIKDNLKK